MGEGIVEPLRVKAGISNVISAVLLLFVCLTVRFVEQRFFLMLYLLFFSMFKFLQFSVCQRHR